MEQKRELRNKYSHIWSNDFQTKVLRTSHGKGQSLQQMVLGKLDIHIQKNEAGPLPHTIYKN